MEPDRIAATRESAALAEKLISQTCATQGISAGQLAIHADRGSSMTSKPVAFLLADLGITQSLPAARGQRQPLLREPVQDAEVPAGLPGPVRLDRGEPVPLPGLLPWYNQEHRHSALGLHTAADIHYGHAPAVQAARAHVLTTAYTAHPERFVRRPPTPPRLPAASWINRHDQKETTAQ